MAKKLEEKSTSLSLIQPMVKALRSGKISEIAKFEDIRPFDITPFFEQKMKEVKFQQSIIESKKAEKEKRARESEDIIQESVIKLIDLGIKAKAAQTLAKKAIKLFNDTVSVNDVVKKAVLLSMEDTNAVMADLPDKIEDSDDLRSILKNNDGADAYEKLKNSGHIAKLIYTDKDVRVC